MTMMNLNRPASGLTRPSALLLVAFVVGSLILGLGQHQGESWWLVSSPHEYDVVLTADDAVIQLDFVSRVEITRVRTNGTPVTLRCNDSDGMELLLLSDLVDISDVSLWVDGFNWHLFLIRQEQDAAINLVLVEWTVAFGAYFNPVPAFLILPLILAFIALMLFVRVELAFKSQTVLDAQGGSQLTARTKHEWHRGLGTILLALFMGGSLISPLLVGVMATDYEPSQVEVTITNHSYDLVLNATMQNETISAIGREAGIGSSYGMTIESIETGSSPVALTLIQDLTNQHLNNLTCHGHLSVTASGQVNTTYTLQISRLAGDTQVRFTIRTSRLEWITRGDPVIPAVLMLVSVVPLVYAFRRVRKLGSLVNAKEQLL